jgi:putative redox protein
MANYLETSVSLTNRKLHFNGTARHNDPISIDYTPPLGDGLGYTSLELLLVSLSSCAGSSVIFLLRKLNKEIESYKINAKGVRKAEHPTILEKIWLQFKISSPNTTKEEIKNAIKLSEEKYCPVWNMLKGNVEIITEIELNLIRN